MRLPMAFIRVIGTLACVLLLMQIAAPRPALTAGSPADPYHLIDTVGLQGLASIRVKSGDGPGPGVDETSARAVPAARCPAACRDIGPAARPVFHSSGEGAPPRPRGPPQWPAQDI